MTAEPFTPPAPAAPRRRRRWPWILLAVVLVLGVAAVVTAELIARGLVQQQVRATAVEQLGLPADHPVDVAVGGGLVLPQLLGGSLSDVRIASEGLPLAGAEVDADLHLTGVPVRAGDASGPGTAELRLDDAALEQLVSHAELPEALAGASIAIAEPDLLLSNEFTVLGAAIPVELSVTPGAADGGLTFAPTAATVGGMELSLDQFGAIVGQDAEPAAICIADQLPSGLTLTGVSVDGDRLVADVDIAEGMLTDPALREPGTCGGL